MENRRIGEGRGRPVTPVANSADEDSAVFILQGRNLPLNPPLLRSGSFLALYGEENQENQTPYDYYTVGGEVRFGKSPDLTPGTRWPFFGSVAYYRSERDTKETDPSSVASPASTETDIAEESEGTEDYRRIFDGDGAAGLLTVGWNQIEVEEKGQGGTNGSFVNTTLKRSISLRFGFGSGDDPDTPELDEGYIGETASFTPDKLFLGRFARLVDTEGRGTVGRGLGNKVYGGLIFSDRTWSLLQHPLWWLYGTPKRHRNDPKRDPIISRTTTLRLHYYRFDEPVLDSREAGWEWGIDFEAQVPKGIKTTLGVGQFFPGEALEPIIDADPFIFNYSVSVTLK